ncbi:MAG: GntR family transcriptional regulator, partial [Actinomycetota bacterium]|nr:GntR family transcriptional regulator [Actinomycetota bacterium]
MDDKAPDLLIRQAPRKKLAETVAHQILEAIRDLAPGTRLPPERELTKRLGVGRSTVREALNGLAMIGVVEIRHGQGVFVTEPTGITVGVEGNRALPPKAITDELLE